MRIPSRRKFPESPQESMVIALSPRDIAVGDLQADFPSEMPVPHAQWVSILPGWRQPFRSRSAIGPTPMMRRQAAFQPIFPRGWIDLPNLSGITDGNFLRRCFARGEMHCNQESEYNGTRERPSPFSACVSPLRCVCGDLSKALGVPSRRQKRPCLKLRGIPMAYTNPRAAAAYGSASPEIREGKSYMIEAVKLSDIGGSGRRLSGASLGIGWERHSSTIHLPGHSGKFPATRRGNALTWWDIDE